MALTVETGAGVPTADSWVSVSEAKSYAAKMGRTAFADADDEVLEPALRRAVLYLDAVYGTRYAGQPTNPDPNAQRMSWPRKNVIMDSGYALPDNVIPANLKAAQVEAAVIEYTAPGALQPSSSSGTRGKKSVQVGPISVTYDDPITGSGGGSYNGMALYPVVDGLMFPLLDTNKAGMTNWAYLRRA